MYSNDKEIIMKNKIAEEASIDMNKCRFCGESMRPGARFCSKCGKKQPEKREISSGITRAAGPGPGGLQATSDPNGFSEIMQESIYKKIIKKLRYLDK